MEADGYPWLGVQVASETDLGVTGLMMSTDAMWIMWQMGEVHPLVCGSDGYIYGRLC